MEYDAKAVAERIMDTLQKEHKELKSFNIMVLGKTGVWAIYIRKTSKRIR